MNNEIIRNALDKCDNYLKNIKEDTDIPEKNEIIIKLDNNKEEPKENENSNKISLKAGDTKNKHSEENVIINPQSFQNDNLNEIKIEENNKIEEEHDNLLIYENNNNDVKNLKEHIIHSNSSDGKSASTKIESNYQSNNTEINLEVNSDIINSDGKNPNSQEKDLTQLTDIEKINIALQEVKNKFKENDEEMKFLKDNNSRLAIRVKSLEGDNNKMENKIKSLEGDRNIMEKEIKSLKGDKAEMAKRIKSLEGNKTEMAKRIKSLEGDNNKMKKESKIMKDDIQNLKDMLGSIQVRDLAKNFMNQFTYLLTKNDYYSIKKKYKSKWEKIRERVEICFQAYKNNPKYDSFIELFKKSEKVIESGNNEAHSIALAVYEKNIIDTAKKHNLSLTDSNKIFFLLQLGVSEKSFKNGYKFLNEYFGENMERKILKDNPLDNFFK